MLELSNKDWVGIAFMLFPIITGLFLFIVLGKSPEQRKTKQF